MVDELLGAGCIDGGLGEQDLYFGDIIDIPTPTYTFLDTRSERRQGTSECALFAAIGAIEDNRSREFTAQEIDNMRKMLPLYGWTVKDGMYLSKAGDLVVDYLDSIGEKRKKVTIKTYSEDFKNYLDMGYTVDFGSQIGTIYTNDIKEDGDVDKLFGGSIGHARRLFKNKTNKNYYIVENFKGSLPYNVVEITPDMLDKQLQAGKLFFQSFIFYPLSNMLTDSIPHYKGNTPKEIETVKAREDLVNNKKITPRFMDYLELQGFVKIVTEIGIYRDKNKA